MEDYPAREASVIAVLLPIIIVSIPIAIGNYFLAKRLNRSVGTWVVLSLIPLLNYLFFVYVWYVVILHVIDRLKGIAAALKVPETP